MGEGINGGPGRKKEDRGKVDDKKEEEDEKPKLSGQGRSGNEENKAAHLTAVTSGGPKSKKMTTHKLVGVSDEIQLD